MNAFDAVHLVKLALVLVFLAPPTLAAFRGAVLPAILAALLSAIGLGAVFLGASSDLSLVASMVALSSADYAPPAALQLERLAVSLAIVGSATWLGAMIAALAGYVGRR